jgi:hypothetical protein
MSQNVVVASLPTVEPTPPRLVKLSWGGLIGGIFVAVGVWLLLSALGLAVGLSSFEPSDTMHRVKSVGIGTGIWSLVVSIIALFVGGLVASRTSGIIDRPTGAIHGAVLWSLATILSIVLVGGVVRSVVRAAANAAGLEVSVGNEQVENASPAELGIDTTTLVGPVTDRLRAEGKTPASPSEIQTSLQSALNDSLSEGRVDKDILTTAIAENTGLSRGGARDIANRVEAQMNQRAGAASRDLRAGALTAAESVGHAMWWVFLGMVLGLIAAVVGSTLGVTRKQRLAAGVVVEPPPLAVASEVHP